jgi:predicted nucleic acid-binding protein
MTASAFVDTNVLLYAGSQHPEDQAKRNIALELLKRQDLGFSAQVMAEYFNAAYSKGRLGISLETAIANLEILAKRPVLPVTSEIVLEAARIVARYQVSYYDAAIIAAATYLGCTTLYSEDLNHGQHYGTVQVINPFV